MNKLSFDLDTLGLDLHDLDTDAHVRGGKNVVGCSAVTNARAYTGLAQKSGSWYGGSLREVSKKA
jgi:hypothetical protein